MKNTFIRCARCEGRKKVYKINSGYSLANTGGTLVDCPLCLGTGTSKPFQESCEAVKNEVNKILGTYNETKEIYDACKGKEVVEVFTANTVEKPHKKRKDVKDDEKEKDKET